ncbi:MAG: zf-TFIIB domain-containing protein [Pseudomonadota bacterium]
MKCPIDGAELVMTDRSGVEIDYCPTCRGVWLDRGELDKIIERSVQAPPPPPQRGYSDDYDQGRDDGRSYKKKRRASSFLDDIFDF